MIGSLNRYINDRAQREYEAQQRWRRLAYSGKLWEYALYIFFRSRGFATRHMLQLSTYCIELFGIAMFVDLDIFYAASHITGAFFLASLINYGAILYYRSQILRGVDIALKNILAVSLTLSLPLVVWTLWHRVPEFMSVGQSILLTLAFLRLADQVFEFGVMLTTAETQVKYRIYFPFWANLVFLGASLAIGAASIFIVQSIYALIFGTFASRLVYAGFYYRQAKKTKEMSTYLGLRAVEQKTPMVSSHILLSVLVVVSPFILPTMVTVFSHVPHSEKTLIWFMQILLGALVIRPMTGIFVDILQRANRGKFSDIHRFVHYSSRLSWPLLAGVIAMSVIIGSLWAFPLTMMAWCVLAITSKIVIYRALLVGREDRLYSPAVTFKIVLPIAFYTSLVGPEFDIWLLNCLCEVGFLVWALAAAKQNKLLENFKFQELVPTAEQTLFVLHLSVSLKTLNNIRRFRSALGDHLRPLIVHSRCVIVAIPTDDPASTIRQTLMTLGNWILKIQAVHSREQLAHLLGMDYTALSRLPALNPSPTSLANTLRTQLTSYAGIEVWFQNEGRLWRTNSPSPSSPRREESIYLAGYVNRETKNISDRIHHLIKDPGSFYYSVKNGEEPIAIVYSPERRPEIAAVCREFSQRLLLTQLGAHLPEKSNVTDLRTENSKGKNRSVEAAPRKARGA